MVDWQGIGYRIWGIVRDKVIGWQVSRLEVSRLQVVGYRLVGCQVLGYRL